MLFLVQTQVFERGIWFLLYEWYKVKLGVKEHVTLRKYVSLSDLHWPVTGRRRPSFGPSLSR